MLTHLSIKSLTLVDTLDLEFDPGMSVITGETGAGKSIMLGALGLALGDRADSSLVSKDAGKAEVNASFDLANHEDALAWLQEKSLEDGDDCILRRVVSKDGRSRAFVNGSAITLNELKQLSEMLLDIHSQHEHQSLLKVETHARLLDEFGGLSEVVAEVRERYEQFTTLSSQLDQMRADAEAQSAQVQLLSYQVEELTTLAVIQGETESLADEQKRLNSADDTFSRLVEVIALCDKDSDSSASSLVTRAINLISNIEDERLSSIQEMLNTAQIQLDEAMTELSSSLDGFEADPERLREVEDRLSSIYELARKHKVEPDDIAELTERLSAELDAIVNADAHIESLEAELNQARADYQTQADKLTAARTQTAKLLETEVTTQLQSLGMDGATFTIQLQLNQEPSRNGNDVIEFLITTIPGSEAGSLSRIASGGELSRISLAIQVVTAKTSNTPTLVFDEVDVGVGGATAEVVGSLLRKLGSDAQIICVTHLPQVAAQGHHHYVVQKSTTEDSAETTVTKLNEEQKVDEIARMLGGIEKTDQSVAHAVEMVASATNSSK